MLNYPIIFSVNWVVTVDWRGEEKFAQVTNHPICAVSSLKPSLNIMDVHIVCADASIMDKSICDTEPAGLQDFFY